MGFIERTAIVVATVIGKKLERKIRNIAGLSPMPNQSIASGIQARGDMGRKKFIMGLRKRATNLYPPKNDTQGDAKKHGQIETSRHSEKTGYGMFKE